MPAPTNTRESREFEINRLSNGRGYAFLTDTQKKSVNAIADPAPVAAVKSTADAASQGNASPIVTSGIRRHVTSNPTGSVTATPPTYQSEAAAVVAGLDRTPPTAIDEKTIREQELERVQAELDSIDSFYESLVVDENIRGEGRLGQGRAINARSGLLGQDFGNQAKDTIVNANKQQVQLIQREKEAKRQAVLSKSDDRAAKRIAAERNDALKNTETYLQFLKESQDDARSDVKELAKTGTSLAELSDEEYTRLVGDTGYKPLVFDAVWNNNLPQAEQSKYTYQKIGDGKIVRFNETLGGEPEEFDFDVPTGFDFRMAGNLPVFVNESTGEIRTALPDGFTAESLANLGKNGGGAGNPGDYTDQEMRRLREANVDPTDVKAADDYLYGTGVRKNVTLEETQIPATAQAIRDSVGAKDGFENLKQAIQYFQSGQRILDIEGLGTVQLDENTATQIADYLIENRGPVEKLFGVGV